MKTKTITMKKPGGGTRKQKVQVLASGKYKFIKNNPGRKSNRKRNPSNKKNRRRNRVANKNKKRRHNNNLVGTTMKFVRIGALLGPGAFAMMQNVSNTRKITLALRYYTGFDIESGIYRFEDLATGWLPYLSSVMVTRGIQKVSGILRRI